jgi:hypothetical protein
MMHQSLSPLARLPEVFPKLQRTISTIITYNTFVAIVEMGHWHCGTIDNCTRKLQICSSIDRILHQMDRGEASSQHSGIGAQEIFLAKHNMSFRVPRKITVDNAKQFDYHIFEDFCHQMGSK